MCSDSTCTHAKPVGWLHLVRGGPIACPIVRRLALGLAAAAIAFTLAACSAVNPEAVRIDDRSVSQREFDEAVAALAKHPAGATAAGAVAPTTTGAIAARDDSTTVFKLEVLSNVFATMADKLGQGSATPAADADAAAAFGIDPAALAAFPTSLHTRVGAAAARATTTRLALNGPPPTEADERAFFETVKDQVNGATFEDVQSQIQQQLRTEWDTPFQAALASTLKAVAIRIDPKYGSWDAAKGFSPPAVPLAGGPAPVPAGT